MERQDNKDFSTFACCLAQAGKCMNDAHYFQLPVSGKENPIFRERVYCYELYHQIRLCLGDNFGYKLDGEVDKTGHPAIPNEIKPDFIVHVPGNMDHNLVVIEVKPLTTNLNDFEHDLAKIEWLIRNAYYYRAIMLVYGDNRTELATSFTELTKIYSKRNENRILLAWHQGYGKEIKYL